MTSEKLSYWLMIIVGGWFVYQGMSSGNYGSGFLGCFLGIVARIMQAEVHHAEDKKHK